MAEASIYAIKNHPKKQKQNTTPKKFLSKKWLTSKKRRAIVWPSQGQAAVSTPWKKGGEGMERLLVLLLRTLLKEISSITIRFHKNDRPADDWAVAPLGVFS